MSGTLYLRCKPGDVAQLVLLTGDPARVESIATLLESVNRVSQNREYAVATGEYKERRVSAVSAGIGAPSTAIALEELAQLGVKTIVRVGTMMGVTSPQESVVISTGAVRNEGTSIDYLPTSYPAVPDWRLVQALAASGRRHDLDLRLGLTATYDSFYPKMAPSLVYRGAPDFSQLRAANVLALDMETSLVYIASTSLGMASASMCMVTVQSEPFVALDTTNRASLERRLIRAVLDCLVTFALDDG